MASKQQHWLISVAGAAAAGDLGEVNIPLDTPPADAWEAAAAGLGISQEALAEHVAKTFRMQKADLENIEPDPLDVDAEKEIGFASGRNTEFEIAPPPRPCDTQSTTRITPATPTTSSSPTRRFTKPLNRSSSWTSPKPPRSRMLEGRHGPW